MTIKKKLKKKKKKKSPPLYYIYGGKIRSRHKSPTTSFVLKHSFTHSTRRIIFRIYAAIVEKRCHRFAHFFFFFSSPILIEYKLKGDRRFYLL